MTTPLSDVDAVKEPSVPTGHGGEGRTWPRPQVRGWRAESRRRASPAPSEQRGAKLFRAANLSPRGRRAAEHVLRAGTRTVPAGLWPHLRRPPAS